MDMLNIKELIKGNTKEKRIVIIDPNYWKSAIIDPNYWKSAIIDPKILQILKSRIELLECFDGGKTVLFDIIESEKELAFVRNLTNGNALLAGNVLEKEKQYKLTNVTVN